MKGRLWVLYVPYLELYKNINYQVEILQSIQLLEWRMIKDVGDGGKWKDSLRRTAEWIRWVNMCKDLEQGWQTVNTHLKLDVSIMQLAQGHS